MFFDHRAGTNTSSVHTDIQWHPTFALLAVATKIDDADNEAQGAVSLFFDEVSYDRILCLLISRMPIWQGNLVSNTKIFAQFLSYRFMIILFSG